MEAGSLETTRPHDTAPVAASERITNLDAIRGFAVLGILVMNAVSFGLPPAAYWNIGATSGQNWFDWLIGGLGELFVDQKMMGLFSMLFGTGIVLFADRAEAKGQHPVRFSLWRNLLLLGIGLVHTLWWEGDVLVVYALCAPVLIVTRRVAPRKLMLAGGLVVLTSALAAVATQGTVDPSGLDLGNLWFTNGSESQITDPVGVFFYYDVFARALGMMLIGVGLFKLGVLHGNLPRRSYVRMVRYGFGFGLPLAAMGLVIQARGDFGASIAIIGEAPNTIATIPMVMGYIGAIVLWNQGPETELHRRVRAAGRMALTNYLTQSMTGVIVLRGIFEKGSMSRGWIALFILAVWVLQLAWSLPWLNRFRFGPIEWLWHSLTYRHLQPVRR